MSEPLRIETRKWMPHDVILLYNAEAVRSLLQSSRRALSRLDRRAPEDVEEWARNLARQISEAP